MDTKRLILYVLLGIICFALWQAWQKDYGKPITPVTKEAQAQTAVSDKAAIKSTTTPQVPVTEPAAIPAAIKAAPRKITPVVTRAVNVYKVPQARLIRVHTDALEIAIDRKGGNIVGAKLLKYKKELDDPRPVELLSDDISNLYLAQSGLVSAEGPDTKTSQALYHTAQENYTLAPDQKNLLVKLTWENKKGLEVNKTFLFSKGNYDIKVNYEIVNNSKQTFTGQFYAQLQHKNVEVKPKRTFRSRTYIGAAISSKEHPYEKLSYKKLAEENLNRYIQGGWLALQEHYFLSTWIPHDKNKTYRYFSDHSAGEFYTIGLIDRNVSVSKGDKLTIGSTLYTGPEIAKNLKALAPHLDLTVDYGWLWMISVVLFWIMEQIHKVVGNWGWSIVLVTVLIKALFYKLSESSFRSMARMKVLAPRLKALKERYGSDKQKLSQATMELYKKEKINPLGGCLPILIQIPVFIALYYVLVESVQLRQAPFIFWIHDLSTKDPYYILPILMGISMFVQQRLTPQSPDPTQAKMMMFLPVVFTIFFLSFPSGLVLYWFVNNCLTVLQQWYINKKLARSPVKVKKKT